MTLTKPRWNNFEPKAPSNGVGRGVGPLLRAPAPTGSIGELFSSRNQHCRDNHGIAVFDELVLQLAALRILAATLRSLMGYAKLLVAPAPRSDGDDRKATWVCATS
jgi:hypothetical protein